MYSYLVCADYMTDLSTSRRGLFRSLVSIIYPSLQSVCAHSWKLFDIFLGPIVIFSEQAQKHWNEHMARFTSGCGTCARQPSA